MVGQFSMFFGSRPKHRHNARPVKHDINRTHTFFFETNSATTKRSKNDATSGTTQKIKPLSNGPTSWCPRSLAKLDDDFNNCGYL